MSPGPDHAREPNAPLGAGKLPGDLLQRLIEAYRTVPDPDVVIPPGYGSDAAAVTVSGDAPLIVKSDPITFASSAAARYLVAVNANDIACLGGTPRWLSVILLVPDDGTSAADVEAHFSDLQIACNDAGISVIGGHTEVTSAVTRPVLAGTMLGTVGPSGLVRPGGGRPGDDLLLTKWIGIEGTALLARERPEELRRALGEDVVKRAAKLLRSPGISIVRDAKVALSVAGVTALHDPTEGGLATAVHEMASVCGCGADILADAMPVLPETTAICTHFGIDAWGLLSSGALLIAVDRDRRQSVENACRDAGIPTSHIGQLTEIDNGVTAIGANGRSALPRYDADEIVRVL